MAASTLASKWCKSRRGKARRIVAWRGGVWPGGVGLLADDLSAEGFGPLRWVLRNPDKVANGLVGWDLERSGEVRYGLTW